MGDSLGDRMKKYYEERSRFKLTRRVPVVMRIDGRAFHTLTKRHCQRPFDENFQDCMYKAALAVLDDTQGAKCAYIQSDEISVLLTDYDQITTEAWFDYEIDKITTSAATTASVEFTLLFGQRARFDARAFNIPRNDVTNYFIWRQKDWIRNSVQMLGRAHFSHKELNRKKQSDIHEMLHGIGVNWAHLEPSWKNGILVYRKDGSWVREDDIIITQNREVFEPLINPDLVEEDDENRTIERTAAR